jgi:TonB family protein
MKSKMFKVEGMTRCSAGISLFLHILFLLSAGSLFMPKHLPPQPKPIKIKFIVPKPPPPPEIKKEEVKEEVKKIVKVEPQTLPKPVVRKVEEIPSPVLKTPEPQPVAASARPVIVTTTARMTVPDTLPTAKSFPVSETAVSGNTGIAMVQSSVQRVDTFAIAPRAMQTNFSGEGRGSEKVAMISSPIGKVSLPSETLRSAPDIAEKGRGNEKAAMVSSQINKVSLPLESARSAPDIAEAQADPKVLQGYLGLIQRKIERAKEYPDIARRAGNQGKVKIQFTILKDGRIKNVVLIDKTPHRILNEEALAAISRAGPFDRLPDEIGKETLTVVLPFSFMLN